MRPLSKVTLFAVFYFLSLSLAHSFSGWDQGNSPKNMKWFSKRHFNTLPQVAFLKEEPWSGDYWPTHKGGVSYRWASEAVEDKERWLYSTPGKGVTTDALSPIEKYDLYLGNEDFYLTNLERRRTGIFTDRKIPEWEGLCHAWAPATYLYKNPGVIHVKGALGHDITFYSSDIKALLTTHLHYNDSSKTKFLGSRCNLDFSELEEKYKKGLITKEELNYNMNRPECTDTNPGAFHVILTNFIGRLNKSFIIDKTRDLEVWNQPVYGYESKVLERKKGASEGAHPSTKEEVTLETVVYYISEVSQGYERELVEEAIATIKLVYKLELNFFGRIIGGTWLSHERPDFIWAQNRPPFQSDFKKLGKLYKLSIK